MPIVPFLPGPKRDIGLFQEEADDWDDGHSALESFEHDLKKFVDFGLFFFAFANAGVAFTAVNELTWIVLGALLIGKVVGIAGFSYAGHRLGFPLPSGMDLRHLIVAGVIAGIGLTVALFVANEAFIAEGPKGAAKMGALLSGLIFIVAIVLGKLLRVSGKADA